MYCFYSNTFYFRLLIHDPDQRLGANGASEVVVHHLYLSTLSFKQISLAVPRGDLKDGVVEFISSYYMAALQVKAHPFFKGINWDTLALQKVSIRSCILHIAKVAVYIYHCQVLELKLKLNLTQAGFNIILGKHLHHQRSFILFI